MYAEERRRVVVEQARQDGRVEVAALAEQLGVTHETVRRDLTDLERRGIVRRVHGGAIPIEWSAGEPALSEKSEVMHDLRVDLALVATNGLSAVRGLSTHDSTEAQVKAAVLGAARETVLLADNTKVGAAQLIRYATLDSIDLIISDSGLDDERAEELEAAGPKVVHA